MEYKSHYGNLDFEKKGHVAYLTFNNPKTLNALSVACFRALNELFDQFKQDKDIWGIILTGAGRSFIAGADLSDEFAGADQGPVDSVRDIRLYIQETLNKIADCPQPTVAAINGYALGGGAELALCCDFRFASNKAKIGFPEVKLGGIPGYTGPSRATKILGPTAAKEMIMTGKHYTAQEAYELRYVTKVTEPENLIPAAEEFLETIMKQAQVAVRYGKFMVDRSMEMSLDAALEYERMISILLTRTEDYKEGMAAFREKRRPMFQNK